MYERFIRPILFRHDPEHVHDKFVRLGRLSGSSKAMRKLLALRYDYENPKLVQTVAGIKFRNPVGLAAGFDKDCQLMRVLPSVGFGYEEVGSITAEPYEGNPKPRLTRLPKDKSIIVYYGLKNLGAKALLPRLKGPFAIPIGVSVAKTNKHFRSEQEKLDDWTHGIIMLKDAGDYLTINLSCPNTYDSTNYCDPQKLQQLLEYLEQKHVHFRKPVFLKISADLAMKQADEIIELCWDRKYITGFILTNLVKNRSTVLLHSDPAVHEKAKGGLSGKVVKPRALALLQHFAKQSQGRFVLIGCGGIFTAEDAYEYLCSGASLVQLVTGLIYGGPETVRRINEGLVKLMERDGFSHISELKNRGPPIPAVA